MIIEFNSRRISLVHQHGRRDVTWKHSILLHDLHVRFTFWYTSLPLSSWQRREMIKFEVMWKTRAPGYKVQFSPQTFTPFIPILSKKVCWQLPCWTNWSCIFIFCSRSRGSRPCFVHERRQLNGQIWGNMEHAKTRQKLNFLFKQPHLSYQFHPWKVGSPFSWQAELFGKTAKLS